MNQPKINPEMVVLARESRGITQNRLARMTGIGQSVLSKYENGWLDIPPEAIHGIAKVLEYPEDLFTWQDSDSSVGSICLHHRKRQSLPIGDLKRIHAKIHLMEQRIRRLLKSVEIETEYEFPHLDIAEYGDPEYIADIVRQVWHLPMGPIRDLLSAIERTGAMVIVSHLGTRKLDAISYQPADMLPILLINDELPWERICFSLAHELGHLIMHQRPTPNPEDEADAFASAFLMPRREIRMELKDITLSQAMQLKPYWRVSMQALIRRAYSLDQIPESKYRRLFTQLTKQGFRVNEPQPLSREEPYILRKLIDVHVQDHGYTIPELSQLLGLYEREFMAEYLPRSVMPIRIVRSTGS